MTPGKDPPERAVVPCSGDRFHRTQGPGGDTSLLPSLVFFILPGFHPSGAGWLWQSLVSLLALGKAEAPRPMPIPAHSTPVYFPKMSEVVSSIFMFSGWMGSLDLYFALLPGTEVIPWSWEVG